MITRAEKILRLVEEVISPFVAAAAIGAGTAAIHATSQLYQAKRRTTEKIQQAGLGAEHQQTKARLSTARKHNIATLGLSTRARANVIAQKNKLKDIKNRGLQHYQATLSQNPAQHAQGARSELAH